MVVKQKKCWCSNSCKVSTFLLFCPSFMQVMCLDFRNRNLNDFDRGMIFFPAFELQDSSDPRFFTDAIIKFNHQLETLWLGIMWKSRLLNRFASWFIKVFFLWNFFDWRLVFVKPGANQTTKLLSRQLMIWKRG